MIVFARDNPRDWSVALLRGAEFDAISHIHAPSSDCACEPQDQHKQGEVVTGRRAALMIAIAVADSYGASICHSFVYACSRGCVASPHSLAGPDYLTTLVQQRRLELPLRDWSVASSRGRIGRYVHGELPLSPLTLDCILLKKTSNLPSQVLRSPSQH